MAEPGQTEPTPRRSPLLSGPDSIHGAVAGGGPDAGVAAHYGQPAAEQRALDEGRAIVDLSHRAVLSVSGPDRLSWLDTLSSQRLADAPAGTSTQTLFLDVQGRIEFDVQVLEDGAATWLITEGERGPALVDWLVSMRFAHQVTLRDHTGTVAVVGATAAVPGWEDRTVWIDPWPHIAEGGYPYSAEADPSRHPAADWTWREYLVTLTDLQQTAARLGAGELAEWRLAGTMASEALRIAAARPRQGREMDDRTIPHELDLLRTAVHLTKGCYRGQETVARVHNLGRPPRRLVLLHLDGSGHTLPQPGSDLILRPSGQSDAPELEKARPVGRLTSVALHHEMGPIALGVLKRNVDPTAELLVRDTATGERTEYTAAAQEVVVSPDSGQVVGRPAGLLRGPR
ncbi:YgfZ/GcvT domain-containing protein [Micrococcus terreus]|uniref:GCVT N-terminal domain-containing protein n=1 Tax=Micrococcus terreus TaxID=574650 RepID=A0A1I7MDS2_9MICC|nr:hypothetical protein SAMN04487966_10199 [Micrococcus terreus]